MHEGLTLADYAVVDRQDLALTFRRLTCSEARGARNHRHHVRVAAHPLVIRHGDGTRWSRMNIRMASAAAREMG